MGARKTPKWSKYPEKVDPIFDQKMIASVTLTKPQGVPRAPKGSQRILFFVGTVIWLVPASVLAKSNDFLPKCSTRLALHFGKESAHLARTVARTSQITVPKKIFV